MEHSAKSLKKKVISLYVSKTHSKYKGIYISKTFSPRLLAEKDQEKF